jgi:hypothetical protein
MVIAMLAMRVVKMAVHQEIDMIAVRDHLVAAAGAVLVLLVVAATDMARRAVGGIGCIDRQPMLLDAAGTHVVQMAVVQVIDMPVVLDGLVPAVGAMLVSVIGVDRCHESPPFRR